VSKCHCKRLHAITAGIPCEKIAEFDEELDNYALLFTSSIKGGHSGYHFAMTVTDAMKFCSSDKSKGKYMGSEWAYHWTRVTTYLIEEEPHFDIRKWKDNNKYDKIIADLGLTKIGLAQFAATFTPLGIEVVTADGYHQPAKPARPTTTQLATHIKPRTAQPADYDLFAATA